MMPATSNTTERLRAETARRALKPKEEGITDPIREKMAIFGERLGNNQPKVNAAKAELSSTLPLLFMLINDVSAATLAGTAQNSEDSASREEALEQINAVLKSYDIDVPSEMSRLKEVLASEKSRLDAGRTEIREQLDTISAQLAVTAAEKTTLEAEVARLALQLGSEKSKQDELTGQQQVYHNQLRESLSQMERLKQSQQKLESDLQRTSKDYEQVSLELDSARSLLELLRQKAPEGDVCLVFTDVQGSTTQWEMHADVMEKTLALHNQLMRDKIKEYDGYEVKTEGDAFMIAFENCRNAAQWCIATQLELLKADWPERSFNHPDAVIEHATTPDGQKALIWRGLRVRMGIHFGSPRCEQDPVTTRMDYFGPMVNRSARVEGHAFGGQILLSRAVLESISILPETSPAAKEDADVDEMTRAHELCKYIAEPLCKIGVFKPLGNFVLKGIEGKELLTQLLPRELELRHFPDKSEAALPRVASSADVLDEHSKLAVPTGEVTLVVMHVDGFSEQMQRNAALMGAARKIYKATVRESLAKEKGYESRANGDQFTVAFSSAVAAARWAIDLQKRLVDADWPHDLLLQPESAQEPASGEPPFFRGLRVAMGMHTGEPTCEIDPITEKMDYWGVAVTAAARLDEMAAGGQILLSQATRSQLEKYLAEGKPDSSQSSISLGLSLANVHLEPQGRVVLKGVDNSRPQRIHQMVHVDQKARLSVFPNIATKAVNAGGDKIKRSVTALIEGLQQKKSGIADRLSNLNTQVIAAQSELTGLSQTLRTLQTAEGGSKLGVALAEALSTMDSLNKRQNAMDSEILIVKSIAVQLDKVLEDHTEGGMRLRELEKDVAVIRATRDQLEEEKRHLQAKLDDISKKGELAREDAAKDKVKREQLIEEVKKLKAQVSAKDEQLAALQVELEEERKRPSAGPSPSFLPPPKQKHHRRRELSDGNDSDEWKETKARLKALTTPEEAELLDITEKKARRFSRAQAHPVDTASLPASPPADDKDRLDSSRNKSRRQPRTADEDRDAERERRHHARAGSHTNLLP